MLGWKSVKFYCHILNHILLTYTGLMTPYDEIDLCRCRLVTSVVLLHSPESDFTGNDLVIYPRYVFENFYFKITTTYLRGQLVYTTFSS